MKDSSAEGILAGGVGSSARGGFIGHIHARNVANADNVLISRSTANVTVKSGMVENNEDPRTGNRAGGFIGSIAGTNIDIVYSSARGDVYAHSAAGGFIGESAEQRTAGRGVHITRSYSTGNVYIAANHAGGFIGRIGNNAKVDIRECFSRSNVNTIGNQNQHSGGFVGVIMAPTVIHDSFATGRVEGITASGLGGFIGQFWNIAAMVNTEIYFSYAAGEIIGNGGGFIGHAPAESFQGGENVFNTTTTRRTTAAGAGVGAPMINIRSELVRGITDEQMRTAPLKPSWFARGIWQFEEGEWPTLGF